jgi:hypothetical protein
VLRKDELAAAELTKTTNATTPIAPIALAILPTIAVSNTKKLSFKEKREHETLETTIPKIETEKASIEKQLSENQPSL